MARWPASGSGGPHASSHATGGTDVLTPAAIAALPTAEKGAANGVASLGADAKVPAVQLPASDTSSLVTLNPATSARNTIQPTGAAVTPLIVKGAASQSANLQEWQGAGGAVLGSVEASGRVTINPTGRAGLRVNAPASSVWDGTPAIEVALPATIATLARAFLSGGGTFYVEHDASSTARVQINGGSASASALDVIGGTTNVKKLTAEAQASNSIPLIARGAASQTVNLQEWQNSASSVMASVGPTGDISTLTAGKGVIVKSPDGLVTRRIGIDNTGAVVATAA